MSNDREKKYKKTFGMIEDLPIPTDKKLEIFG